MTLEVAPSRRSSLVPFASLDVDHPWRRRAFDLFRAFLDEQAAFDPIYGWDGGDDVALQRTWGGWNHLDLLVEAPEAGPLGIVSWTPETGLPHRSYAAEGRARRTVTLTNLYIDPAARGAGRGERLVRAVASSLAHAPHPCELAGPRERPTHLVAVTHGWNVPALATFARAGLHTTLVAHARDHAAVPPAPPGEHITELEAGLALTRGRLEIRETVSPAVDEHGAKAGVGLRPVESGWAASLHELYHGRPPGPATFADEASYRVLEDGEPLLECAFTWSLGCLPRQFTVRCPHVVARPRALARSGLVDALHRLLLARLRIVHEQATARPLADSDRVLRLPLLVPADLETAIAGDLARAGLHRELVYAAAPLADLARP